MSGTSRSWDIEIKDGDTKKDIDMKKRISRVLEMHRQGKTNEEMASATGFSMSTVGYILLREVTFVLG